jgi:hypothetical protein
MSSWGLWSGRQCAGLSTAPPVAPTEALAGGAVNNLCAKPAEFKVCLVCFSMPTAHKRTFRSAFSDTHRSWQGTMLDGNSYLATVNEIGPLSTDSLYIFDQDCPFFSAVGPSLTINPVIINY